MLICWGLKDFVFDGEFLDEWTARFPAAEVHRFPDCGHYVLEDASQEIVPLVRGFIEAHPLQRLRMTDETSVTPHGGHTDETSPTPHGGRTDEHAPDSVSGPAHHDLRALRPAAWPRQRGGLPTRYGQPAARCSGRSGDHREEPRRHGSIRQADRR